MTDLSSFYKGKRVLITGHTGFKGTWLTKMLINMGAMVAGYSLKKYDEYHFWEKADVHSYIEHVEGDVRNLQRMMSVFTSFQPEIVFHLAAQPIVRESYNNPVYTYETNVMGTVNVLECVRLNSCVKSVVNVTTDKVYQNKEWVWGYRENERLNGFDPYSNSKSCSELITYCYKESLMNGKDVSVSTARAGNVIGGGDFSKDRIIPDCVRAALNNEKIHVRNPYSVRPYQHVIEPLYAYLLIAAKQYGNSKLQGCYNVGPNDSNCVTTGTLVDLFCNSWGEGITWENQFEESAPHEANFLKLDCSKIKSELGWEPRWNITDSVKYACDFYKAMRDNTDISLQMDKDINIYLNLAEGK